MIIKQPSKKAGTIELCVKVRELISLVNSLSFKLKDVETNVGILMEDNKYNEHKRINP